MEAPHGKGDPRGTTGRNSDTRGGNCSGFDGSTLYAPSSPTAAGQGGLLQGNQADNPINKLTGIHAPCVPISVVLDLIDRFRRFAV